jgi:photosystem II stability/assembly factor-like uncharacterized protein
MATIRDTRNDARTIVVIRMTIVQRLAGIVLFACAKPPAPIPEPHAPIAEWSIAPTERYHGKQDDLFFANARIGFYGNGAGRIYRTDDGGASWRKVLDRPGTFVRALGFLDDKRGFAGNIGPDSFPGVTDTTLLYRTDDGGETWNAVALPDTDGARGVCAIDVLALDAVVSGHRVHKEIVHVGGRVGGPASLFASDDGGATWQRLALPPEIAMILDVKFLDPSIGFIFAGDDPDVAKGHGVIAKTFDAGRTWKIVYRSQRPYELMWKGAFPSRRIGYATLQNYTGEVAAEDPQANVTPIAQRYVVKTDDGGDHWRELHVTDDPKMQEFGVGFVDDMHGWIGTLTGGFETRDGGATWTTAPTMAKATNKIRIVRDGASTVVWGIGFDLRHTP